MHSNNSNFTGFLNLMNKFGKIFLLTLLFFFISRILFIINYGSQYDIEGNFSSILAALAVGLKFDITVTTFGMVLPFLLICSTLIVPSKNNLYFKFVNNFLLNFSFIMFFIFVLISIIDFYFFKFFQYHLNILFFGIVYDDTKSVLVSVWTDYPLIRIVIMFLFILFIFRYITNYIHNQNYIYNIDSKLLKGSLIIGLFALYFLGMRGSIGTFPIENEDSIISDNSFINNICVNSVFSLKTALEEKIRQTIDTDIDKKMRENGFDKPSDAIQMYTGNTIVDDKLSDYLIEYTSTNEFLKNNPPNVVFIQMESFGSYYLDLHSPSLNVLGKLEDQLQNCILYKNFLSGTSGTIHSMEGLMVGSPLTPISQSTYMDCNLSSSVALPYQKAGYKTNFITSSELGWQNLDKFVPHQYFENVEGCEALLEKIPGSTRCEWGVFDEFLFERMFQILDEKKNPQFIFAMTTTNHTPFSLPDHYKPYPVNIPADLEDKLRTNKSIALKNFTNFQYSNNCLGEFIEKVRNSPLGENTIIAASGDHNTLQLFSFNDRTLLDKFSVPFILYVPDKYLKNSVVNNKKFASHKDIFPTLFQLSLSNAKYLKTGSNLLDEKDVDNFGIINYNVAMNKKGCVLINEGTYLEWEAEGSKYLKPAVNIQNLDSLYKKSKSYKASMSYFIQSDIKNCKK